MLNPKMLKSIGCLLSFLFTAFLAYSQCTEGLGAPLVSETFGSGTDLFAPPLPAGVTEFQYVKNACPMDGQYTIVKYTSGCYGEWHTLTDLSGDPNGYFMIVNASKTLSTFYTSPVNNLCPGTSYEFSAYIVNLDTQPYIEPNITFTIEKADGAILASYTTGNIKEHDYVYWQKFFFYFKTPTGGSDFVLKMRNNAQGGNGNNFAIDNISFAPSGPETSIKIAGSASDTLNNPCGNSVTLSSTVGSCYVNNTYQWQVSSNGTNWTDIAGANNLSYVMNIPPAGAFYYRLAVAGQGNISNPNCRVVSNMVKTINGQHFPLVNNISTHVCAGAYVLPWGKQVISSGVYIDTVFSRSGCDSIVTIVNLSLSAQPDLGKNRSLCVGDTILLNPGSFSSYLWQDGSTLPTYKVTAAGTFWVKVTDTANCVLSDTVHITPIFCSTIKIPNTFTPNGDGINDTWNIPPLQYFPECTVFIYNRWGQPVFNSIGYAIPWDGTNKGKALPAGVYYYVIDLKNNTNPLSGFVTLIR